MAQGERQSTSKERFDGSPPPSLFIPFVPNTARGALTPKTAHGPFALSAAKGLTCYPSNPSPVAQGERKSTSKERFDGSTPLSLFIPFVPNTAHGPFLPKTARGAFALSAAKGLTRYRSNPSPAAQFKRKSTSKERFDSSTPPSLFMPFVTKAANGN